MALVAPHILADAYAKLSVESVGESICVSVDKEQQPHEYQMGRMTFELEQRVELCAQRDKLQAEKAALEEANTSKRAVLEGMGAQLQAGAKRVRC